MVPVGGDVAEARRCQRRYKTVREYPQAVGERLVNNISVIVLDPARNLSEAKCQACPGRSGTAVSCGKARVLSAPSRAFGPLTARQDQWDEARSHVTRSPYVERWNACRHFKFEGVHLCPGIGDPTRDG